MYTLSTETNLKSVTVRFWLKFGGWGECILVFLNELAEKNASNMQG